LFSSLAPGFDEDRKDRGEGWLRVKRVKTNLPHPITLSWHIHPV